MRKTALALVGVLTLGTAACSSDGAGGGSNRDTQAASGADCVDLTGEGAVFTITISNSAFIPGCFTASAAQGISIVNEDDDHHTFTIVGTEVEVLIGAGQTVSGEPITGVVEPGTYDLICAIHPPMTGTVTVVA